MQEHRSNQTLHVFDSSGPEHTASLNSADSANQT